MWYTGQGRQKGKDVITHNQLHNKGWLVDRYEKQGFNIKQISDEVGCDYSTVWWALVRANIKIRGFLTSKPKSEVMTFRCDPDTYELIKKLRDLEDLGSISETIRFAIREALLILP